MTNFKRVVFVVSALMMVLSFSVNAQEETAVETEEVSESPFSVSLDLVSSYVWRGTRFSGAAFQPGVEFSSGGFALGAWGSVGFDPSEAVNEADLYASYAFDFGLSLGVSDYYYQTQWSDLDTDDDDGASSHAFEINAGFEAGSFSLSGNYIVNEGAGSKGGDLYFEAGYSFKNFDFFVGAGDGWHTLEQDFQVCNIGISASKELKISDKFSLPISGAVIMNPNTEILHIVGTISF